MPKARQIVNQIGPELPVGGHLKFFIDQWKKITDNKWVLSTISKGYKLEFQSFPPQTGIIQTRATAHAFKIINSEVEKLLEKAAIEPISIAEEHFRIYSNKTVNMQAICIDELKGHIHDRLPKTKDKVVKLIGENCKPEVL